MQKLGPPTRGGPVPSLLLALPSTLSCGAVFWALLQLLHPLFTPGILDSLWPITLWQLLHLQLWCQSLDVKHYRELAIFAVLIILCDYFLEKFT